jgi:L-alanine-DL-glutamate epimerase-like enolase superfamily enzyme
MKLDFASESWPIAGTFTIARGSKTSAEVVVVRLSKNGVTGQGECVPYARYQETVPQVLEALNHHRATIESLEHRTSIAALTLPYAARNALDCALWDLECKIQNKPAWQVAGLAAPQTLTTAFTLSLDTPEAMAAAAKAAVGRSLLKLKLGRPGDIERLAAIRAAVPHARLIVDANEGWSANILPAMLQACEKHRIELVEQPLPAANDEALRGLTRKTLICADESAHGVKSLADLSGKYDAVNIKLDKTGGLTPALEMAVAAKALGFQIMVGCMLATSLAMAPAALVAQYADYVDLDGPLLLTKDRQPSITYNGSSMLPPPPALWG